MASAKTEALSTVFTFLVALNKRDSGGHCGGAEAFFALVAFKLLTHLKRTSH
jgi:hypothetical protein